MTKRRAMIMGVVLLAASIAGQTLSQEQLSVFAGIIDAVLAVVQ